MSNSPHLEIKDWKTLKTSSNGNHCLDTERQTAVFSDPPDHKSKTNSK